MDLRQLRYFAAVARLGSFTAASRQLHVSQPALGYKIKQLETDLGTTLLERHSRGVTPTSAGTTLLRHAERVFHEMDRAEAAVRRHAGRVAGRLVLGVTPTAGKELLPALLEQLAATSGIELSLRQGLSHELHADIFAGRLDMAFCFDPPASQRLSGIELFRERLCLIGPPALVTSKVPLPFDRLSDFPLILDSRFVAMRAAIEETAERRQTTLKVSLEVEPVELKRTLMVRNRVCTIVPFSLFHAEIASGALVARRIVRPTLRRTLHLLWRRGIPAPIVTTVTGLARQVVERRIKDKSLGWERREGADEPE